MVVPSEDDLKMELTFIKLSWSLGTQVWRNWDYFTRFIFCVCPAPPIGRNSLKTHLYFFRWKLQNFGHHRQSPNEETPNKESPFEKSTKKTNYDTSPTRNRLRQANIALDNTVKLGLCSFKYEVGLVVTRGLQIRGFKGADPPCKNARCRCGGQGGGAPL